MSRFFSEQIRSYHMDRYNRFIILSSLALLAITALIIVTSTNRTGIVEGKVTIGPFNPVEPSTGPVVPPGTYSSRSLILTPRLGAPTYIPLSEDGSFRAEVGAGVYQATLSDCVFLGCKSSLPVSVTVVSGETTVLSIDIDTGIR